MKRTPILVASLLALATAATAQGQRNSPLFGAEVGVYYFQDSQLSDIFGATPSIGVGSVSPDRGRRQAWRSYSDIGLIRADKDGSRLLMVPVTFGLVYSFANTERDAAQPYFRFGGGFAYTDYAINTNAGRMSGSKFLPTGMAELGVVFINRIRLAARYNWFQETDDLSFRGLELSLSYVFVRI
jgi:hypothetical protein